MILPKQLLFLSVSILFFSSILGTAKAELVSLETFEFTGQSSVTLDGSFFRDVGFEVLVSIDSNAPDQMDEFFNTGIGSFIGATTTVSFDFSDQANQNGTDDIVDVLATNVTAITQTITQNNFGGSNFLLVNPSNFFNPAIRVNFDSGVIPDPNSINPFTEPVPTINRFDHGGLSLELESGSNLTFNGISSLSVVNATASPSANVPEPTSFVMVGIGLLTVSLKRRRRLRRRWQSTIARIS